MKQYHGDPMWNQVDDDDVTQPQRTEKLERQSQNRRRESQSNDDADLNSGDDFLQDGFFAGNERRWRKHQERVRKLYGRIRQLSDDQLQDADDDDVEDLCEDLDDALDDADDDALPQSVTKWLSCQLRWWKSRFQRKHRGEKLLQGCGRQHHHAARPRARRY